MEPIRSFSSLLGGDYIPDGGALRTSLSLVQIEVQDWESGGLLDPLYASL